MCVLMSIRVHVRVYTTELSVAVPRAAPAHVGAPASRPPPALRLAGPVPALLHPEQALTSGPQRTQLVLFPSILQRF